MKWKELFLTFTLSVQPSLLSHCREQQTRSLAIPPSWFVVTMLSLSLYSAPYQDPLFFCLFTFPCSPLFPSLYSLLLSPLCFSTSVYFCPPSPLFSVFLSFSPPFLALLLCPESLCARLTEMQSWSLSSSPFLFLCFSFFPPSSWNRPVWKQIKGA